MGYTAPTKGNGSAFSAAEFTDLADAVERVDSALGANPQASTALGVTYADADARMEAIEAAIVAFGTTGIKNLLCVNNASTPNTKVDVSADILAVQGKILTSFSRTADIGSYTGGAPTVNGRDFSGSPASGTWYYLWAIYNPTTDVGDTLWSASSTAPTLPSGYSRKRRIGAWRTDGSGNLLRALQQDRSVLYLDTDGTISGSGGLGVLSGGNSASFATVSCNSLVPPTSRQATVRVGTLRWAAFTIAAHSVFVRAGGGTNATGVEVINITTNHPDTEWVGVVLPMRLNASQEFSYRISTAQGAGPVGVCVLGYEDTI